ncbi:uncharacterized protein [Dermacentor andersoni]|uniref:uncharacterized protein isoform X1 n=1 Tax=Dermacentor andersoni TaxID=34620 RepID=UPI002416F20A|nr:uncharacterized protein LOC126518491 isoform X1 [Dermacentor andersoni]
MVRKAWVVLLWLPWLSPSDGAAISVCAMTLDQLTRVYLCARPIIPQIVIDVFDAQIKVFPGKTQAEVTRMVCSAVDDDSDLVYEDFMENFTPDVKAIVSAVLQECERSA